MVLVQEPTRRERRVNAYYCIVNLPGVPVREIAAVAASTDAAAQVELMRLAARWPGFETIALYDGERTVAVLADARLGFAEAPLDLLGLAA